MAVLIHERLLHSNTRQEHGTSWEFGIPTECGRKYEIAILFYALLRMRAIRMAEVWIFIHIRKCHIIGTSRRSRPLSGGRIEGKIGADRIGSEYSQSRFHPFCLAETATVGKQGRMKTWGLRASLFVLLPWLLPLW